MIKIYDEELISFWLREKISDYSKISCEHIETDTQISETYGLSSLDAVSLIGELEDWVGADISPSILFEYSTIDDLSEHLAIRDGIAKQFHYRLHLFLNR
jgi:acyl carrier protein